MIQLTQTANFGKLKTGAVMSGGIGYKLLNPDNSIFLNRSSAGIVESAPGIYTTTISVPEDFTGLIVWDTGNAFTTTYWASESINLSQNHQVVSKVNDLEADIKLIRDVTAGRWKIINNQMIFYGEDNMTEVLRFDLLDDSGNPSMDSVFERRLA